MLYLRGFMKKYSFILIAIMLCFVTQVGFGYNRAVLDFVKENKRLPEARVAGYIDLSYASLAGVDLSYAKLSGVDLSHSDLSGANLCYADLSKSTCFLTNFSGANLKHANLSHSNTQNANFSNANLSAANLVAANLGSTILLNSIFDDADLYEAKIEVSVMKGASFKRAELSKVYIRRIDLTNVDFSNANLSNSLICDIYKNIAIQGAPQGEPFSIVDLNTINFNGSDLSGADFYSGVASWTSVELVKAGALNVDKMNRP